MNSKQAHALIEIEKNAREIERLAKLQNAKRYRVYWVNPITSLLHQLPFVDITETEGRDTTTYLVVERGCPFDEARTAVETAKAGKMGVCIKSRWTTYLVERAGMIDVSPEPWSVKHYAKAGYEFAKKPTRAKKNADTETATE